MHDIRTDYPVNDDKNIYVEAYFEKSLTEIIELIHEHWGTDVNIDDVIIGAEHRHVTCLGYDAYDASDWTTYVHIWRN